MENSYCSIMALQDHQLFMKSFRKRTHHEKLDWV